jgi:hypothetical protein
MTDMQADCGPFDNRPADLSGNDRPAKPDAARKIRAAATETAQ